MITRVNTVSRALLRLLLTLLVLFAPLARATTLAITRDEVERLSPFVIVGVVRASHAELLGRRVVSFYTVDVEETWRAPEDTAPPLRVRVALPGGDHGALAQRAAGVPLLEMGARYVLFLGPPDGPDGAHGPLGLWLGVVKIDTVHGGDRAHVFTHAGPSEAAEPLDLLRARVTRVK